MKDIGLLILLSLAGGDKHGYAIQGDIESMTGVRLGPGSLYGAISRLEADGLITGLQQSGRRRPYRLSQSGADEIRARANEFRKFVAIADRRLAAS